MCYPNAGTLGGLFIRPNVRDGRGGGKPPRVTRPLRPLLILLYGSTTASEGLTSGTALDDGGRGTVPSSRPSVGAIAELVGLVLANVRHDDLAVHASNAVSTDLSTLARASRVNTTWRHFSREALYGALFLSSPGQARKLGSSPRAAALIAAHTHSLVYGGGLGSTAVDALAMPGSEFDLIVGWARLTLQTIKVVSRGGDLAALSLLKAPMPGTIVTGR